ncbi:MAG: MMPL family transporter [Candidatus Bruticola sp.]
MCAKSSELTSVVKKEEQNAASEVAALKKDTLIYRGLERLAAFTFRFPRLIIVFSLITCLLCMGYTAKCLTFDADQANLIKRSDGLQREQDRYTSNFPRSEDIVVIVEDGTAQERKAFIDDLANRLRDEPDVFQDVFEKIDVTFLRSYALHYLDPEQLRNIAEQLDDYSRILTSLAQAGSLIELVQQSPLDLSSISSSEELNNPQKLKELMPFVERFADSLIESMETRGRCHFRSPWLDIISLKMEPQDADSEAALAGMLSKGEIVQYNTIADGKIYTLLCRPAYREGEGADESVSRAVGRIREILENLERRHTGVLVGLTGELVLNVDEAQSSTEDSLNSALISLVLIALVFTWAFREIYKPLMAVFGLIIGIGWTMGFTTAVIGHLNLLTVTFATILMGLGIDFGIHFLYRYDEERAQTQDILAAMQAAMRGAGYENLTGAVSTALAFYVLAFTDFTGIAELGIIAGSGILFCYASMMSVLPSLIFLTEDRNKIYEAKGISGFSLLADVEKYLMDRSTGVVLAGVVVTLVALWFGQNVSYDYNLLNLQAKGLQSVRTEMHLINSSEHSLLCGISLAENASEACRLAEQFSRLPSVSSVETAAMLVPGDYDKKAPYLRRIVSTVSSIPLPKPIVRDPEISRIASFRAVGAAIEKDDRQLRAFLHTMQTSSSPEVRSAAGRLEKKIDKLFDIMSSMGPGPIEDGLNSFEDNFYRSLIQVIEFLHAQKDVPPLSINDIPDDLRRREVGRTGLIQVRIFPKGNIWDRPAQERFVRDIQSVDPKVVGMPVMSYYDCQELRESNEKAGTWALCAIWVLLFVHFRKIGAALLSLLPKVLGIVWMVGLMGLLGCDFNSANFLALPLILGIGLVFGIHIIHRVSEEGGNGIFSHSTGPSITLSALTTMIGFATMIPANHQGVATLGLVMTLGVGANLISSAVFMPALLTFLSDRFGYKIKLHN